MCLNDWHVFDRYKCIWPVQTGVWQAYLYLTITYQWTLLFKKRHQTTYHLMLPVTRKYVISVTDWHYDIWQSTTSQNDTGQSDIMTTICCVTVDTLLYSMAPLQQGSIYSRSEYNAEGVWLPLIWTDAITFKVICSVSLLKCLHFIGPGPFIKIQTKF